MAAAIASSNSSTEIAAAVQIQSPTLGHPKQVKGILRAFLDLFKPKTKSPQSESTNTTTTTTIPATDSNIGSSSTAAGTTAAGTTTDNNIGRSSSTSAGTTATTDNNTGNSSPNASAAATTAAAGTTTTINNVTAGDSGVGNRDSGIDEAVALCNLISADLNFINKASEILTKHKPTIDAATANFVKLKETRNPNQLRKLKKSVMILKQQISSKTKDKSETDKEIRNSGIEDLDNVDQADADKLFDGMPHLYKNETFEQSLAFRDFQLLYDSLSSRELKLCLLCFSVFPEDVIIKKRVMIYWWIGEGFVPPMPSDPKTAQVISCTPMPSDPIAAQEISCTPTQSDPITAQEIPDGKTAEDFGNEFFNELITKGFIEPVYEKRSLMVDSCKMHPFVRSAIIILAERVKFFDFDWNGRPKSEFSRSFKACLMNEGLENIDELEKLHMVFNVSEKILELKPEWFSKMKNVNVLYLGRWQTEATHHIEVEETKFLDGLKSMKHLRFLSLQGVSRITELPESVSNLTNLTILDLRACHNLDVIPDGIGLLKSLTHLDMSECYLLDHMPKGLKSLFKLQVLKGFVVGDSKGRNSCTLHDLVSLTTLRKLSIYTGLKNFPTEPELRALNQFRDLRKLTIAWGRGSTTPDAPKAGDNIAQQKNSAAEKGKITAPKPPVSGRLSRRLAFTHEVASDYVVPELPSKLQKLDLQCFPRSNAPNWLKPRNLKKVEKLYIRGGKLCDLGQFRELDDDRPISDTWAVEILRLKYLTELEMDWGELCELFPKLTYVEKVKCPKLTFFPCDGTGVWINKKKNESNL